MKILLLIARYIYAIPLFVFGVNNIVFAEKSIKSVPLYLPFPEIWVYAVGVALILSSVMIAINKFLPVVCSLLGAMLLGFAFMVHFPKLMIPDMIQQGMIGFLKDISIAGAALYIGFNSKTNN